MAYRYPNAVIQVFCKAPRPGQVKTRLIPSLGAEQATAVHSELSRRTLQTATRESLCPVELWCAPSIEHPFFNEAQQRYGVRLVEQRGSDLGERMLYALTDALAKYAHAVLIGADCPSLTPHDLEAAIVALSDETPAVFAPAEDGGYVLVGLKRPIPEIFGAMPWGSSAVMAETRARLARKGIKHAEIARQWDVDTPEDYLRYSNAFSA